jgi:5,10-methenyltetrahydromethanopterin hydrogenase
MVSNPKLAPWDDNSSSRTKDADYFIDMRKVKDSEDVLIYIREKDGTPAENGNILVIRPPKCHIILLSGLDPKFGIKTDDRGCIFVRS